jgi:signal peptidase
MNSGRASRLRTVLWTVAVLTVSVFIVGLAWTARSYRFYDIHTGSMRPTFPLGTEVVVKPGAYHLGEVITFNGPDGRETHRLVGTTSDGRLITKGDANPTNDPFTINQSAVIGHVAYAPRYVGAWLTELKRPLAIIVMALLFVVALIGLYLFTGSPKGERSKYSSQSFGYTRLHPYQK